MPTLFGDPERYAAGLTQVAPGVHAWMQPNGAWGEANAGLVVGEGASLLVDTLWDLRLTRRMLEAMAPLTADAPIRTLVNTHGDGDHWWGNELVGTDDIVATTAAADHEMKAVTPGSMLALRPLGSALERVRPFAASGRFLRGFAAPYQHRGISLKRPTRTFSGRLELDVGGGRGPRPRSGDRSRRLRPPARVLDLARRIRRAAPAGRREACGLARAFVTEYDDRFGAWECPERAVINVHTLHRHLTGRSEPRGPRVVMILAAVGRLAAELPGRAPTALHP